jgi:hypothetical protein
MQTDREPRGRATANDPSSPAYDRNAFRFGFTPQAEIWNGRLAMFGFLAYLLWDLGGYSVLRDVLGLVSGTGVGAPPM